MKVAKTGAYAGILTEGPDFETVYAFGSGDGIGEVDPIIAADRLADELGLDSISSGVTIAFAMELFEKGLLTLKETDGIDLRFGNDEAMMKVLRKIAFRDGIGDLLADGSLAAAKRIGKGTEKYAMQVKGLELPGYDVRGAESPRPRTTPPPIRAPITAGAMPSRRSSASPSPGKWTVSPLRERASSRNGTRMSGRLPWTAPPCAASCSTWLSRRTACQNTATLMEAVTGLSFTPEEVLKVGERVNNLAKAFNVREGFTRADDTLPERLMTEPLKAGASKGQMISREDLDKMLDEYYSLRGWDVKTGTPTRAKLTDLGLAYVADELGL